MKSYWKNTILLIATALALTSCSALDSALNSNGVAIEPHHGIWVEVYEFTYRYDSGIEVDLPAERLIEVLDTVVSTLTLKHGIFALKVEGPAHVRWVNVWAPRDTVRSYVGSCSYSNDTLFLGFESENIDVESFHYLVHNDTLRLGYQSILEHGERDSDWVRISPGSRVWGIYDFKKLSGTFVRAD